MVTCLPILALRQMARQNFLPLYRQTLIAMGLATQDKVPTNRLFSLLGKGRIVDNQMCRAQILVHLMKGKSLRVAVQLREKDGTDPRLIMDGLRLH